MDVLYAKIDSFVKKMLGNLVSICHCIVDFLTYLEVETESGYLLRG